MLLNYANFRARHHTGVSLYFYLSTYLFCLFGHLACCLPVVQLIRSAILLALYGDCSGQFVGMKFFVVLPWSSLIPVLNSCEEQQFLLR